MSRIRIEGVKELQDKLTDPRLIGEPLSELLKDAAIAGQSGAKDALFSDTGTGIALRSILYKAEPTRAMVYSVMPRERALSIEKGRSPGAPLNTLAWLDYNQRPPEWVGPVARWTKFQGFRDLSAGSGSPIVAIIQAISARGVKGKHFMREAKAAIQRTLPLLLDHMARKVEARFKR